MIFKNAKREAALVAAFQKIFLVNGKLSEAGKTVIAFLRDEAGGRGELGRNGVPYFYDANNRFDAASAAFLLGKRRMFDLLIKYLSLDERELFRLGSLNQSKEDNIAEEISV